MHLGIFAKTFPRPTLEETLDAIAERGITHVQFNMSCAGLSTLPERLDQDLCVWIARSFRERGLTMAAISGTFNLCDPNAIRLMDNLRGLEVLASACRWLDTRIITLCTGTRDPDDPWKWHPENVRRDAWVALLNAVKLAVKIADRHEVTLAFEPERNNVVSSVPRARMLLDEIGSPWLKVVIDPANLMRADDRPRLAEILDEAFDWLGPDIVLAHAKNPPYASIGEEIATIREYLERNDPRTLGWQTAIWQMARGIAEPGGEAAEHLEALLSDPVPRSLSELAEFYRSYIHSLRSRNYAGAIVMHGLPEGEVAAVHRILAGLIDQPRRNG
jgi:sugar phosphate isomerase/epimerase